jgi:HEAT repeat protein
LSPAVSGPVVFGAIRPRVLAPEDFEAWPAADREMAMAHELEHVRRGDLAWALVADIVCVLYWPSPLLRALGALHTRATEEACDASTLQAVGDRHLYAHALVGIARRMNETRVAGLAMTRPSGVTGRVDAVLSPLRRGPLANTAALVGAAAMGFAVVLVGPASRDAFAQDASVVADPACTCSDTPPFIRPWPVAELSRGVLNNERELLRLARNGELAQRTAAVRALGDWPTAAARTALRGAVQDREYSVRAEAVTALAKRPGDELELIVNALSDPSCHVAAAAATAMADARPAAAQATLISMSQGNACVVRNAAALGLSGYATPASASVLRRGLADDDERVRAQAAASLSRIGDGGALRELIASLRGDADKHVRQAAAEAIGEVAPSGDNAAVAVLIEALGDDEEHVRYAAAESLSQVGDARAERALLRRLADQNEVVRAAAAEALGRVGGATAAGPLQTAASRDSNEYVRASASEALERIAARITTPSPAPSMRPPL